MEGTPAPAGKRLLVLGAGPAQLGLLAAARERDLFVIALDRDPAAPGFRYADRRAIISTEDEPRISRLAEAERIDGVIAPGIDWPVAIAARVAERQGLSHPISGVVAGLATSKLKQRERLGEAGVPQPRWQIVTEPNETAEVPSVVKAPDRQGQKGLSLVREAGELRGALENAIAESRSGVAIVEELVEGPEVTVNAFSVGGQFVPLTVTDRLTADPPAFGVALAHAWPSKAAGEEAARVAQAAAEALGITDGPTYTQLRIGPDGPQVIELAARLGGGHDAELVKAALGVDLNASGPDGRARRGARSAQAGAQGGGRRRALPRAAGGRAELGRGHRGGAGARRCSRRARVQGARARLRPVPARRRPSGRGSCRR